MKIITKFWRWWYRRHPTPSIHTRENAIAIARNYGLEHEVMVAMEHGLSPDEALQEWDIYSYEIS